MTGECVVCRGGGSPFSFTPKVSRDDLLVGEQHVFEFPNGYGASVIRGPYTYGGRDGLWELGVARFGTGAKRNSAWRLDYSTPITSDVLGHLTVAGVDDALQQISELPAHGNAA